MNFNTLDERNDMNLTKKDICKKVARKLERSEIKLSIEDTTVVFDSIMDEIMNGMVEGYNIELRKFGCFKPIIKKKKQGRNPRTGEVVNIPSRPAPSFKFSEDALKTYIEKITSSI
jgi:nucleoid DNA-binding protein